MTRLDELRTLRDFLDREIAAELSSNIRLRDSQLVGEVAELYGVTTEDILGGSRRHRVANARQGIAWLLKREGMSHRDIARVLGFSDKSTAYYAVKKIERDPAQRALLLGLEVAS